MTSRNQGSLNSGTLATSNRVATGPQNLPTRPPKLGTHLSPRARCIKSFPFPKKKSYFTRLSGPLYEINRRQLHFRSQFPPNERSSMPPRHTRFRNTEPAESALTHFIRSRPRRKKQLYLPCSTNGFFLSHKHRTQYLAAWLSPSNISTNTQPQKDVRPIPIITFPRRLRGLRKNSVRFIRCTCA
jgi:hypothetical protein